MAQISCGFSAAAADIAQVDFIIGPGFAHLSLLDRKISSSAVKNPWAQIDSNLNFPPLNQQLG